MHVNKCNSRQDSIRDGNLPRVPNPGGNKQQSSVDTRWKLCSVWSRCSNAWRFNVDRCMDVDSTTEYGILDQSCLVVGGRNERSVLDTHGMVFAMILFMPSLHWNRKIDQFISPHSSAHKTKWEDLETENTQTEQHKIQLSSKQKASWISTSPFSFYHWSWSTWLQVSIIVYSLSVHVVVCLFVLSRIYERCLQK